MSVRGGRPAAHAWAGTGEPIGLGERVALGVFLLLVLVGALVWITGQLAGVVFGGGWPRVSTSAFGETLARLPSHLGDPRAAWPRAARTDLPGTAGFIGAAAIELLATVGLVAVVHRRRRQHAPHARERGRGSAAQWARGSELRSLQLRSPERGRLVLGRSRGALLAAEPRQSVMAIAPTQTGKTTGLAVPALLEWQGPAVALSVKSDLLGATLARRQQLGDVWVYDPTGSTGVPCCGWTPLNACEDWRGAQRTASWLTSAAAPRRGSSLADADFWYAAAAKLLAPLLFAAATSERTMADVVRWVDTQEESEVRAALEDSGNEAAMMAASASFAREERQRSSIYTTTETILAAYADPGVLDSALISELEPDRLLDGGAHTVYLCAPVDEQRRLRPLFVTAMEQIIARVYELAAAKGDPIDPALLIVMDEAANIAPLPDLDALASTGSGQGVQLLTLVQDLGQVRERWGGRANTIVNNHRAKFLGAGISDPDTLDYAARILGDEQVRQVSSTAGEEGRGSTTQSSVYRPIAPAHVLREGEPGTGVLIYGNLPPAHLHLRPWFNDRELRRLAASETEATR
jgi:type IV secretion system protein VirD4